QLVPPNNLVRKMEAAIDFTFIYDLVKDMYSELGRPSIDPVILVPYTRPRTKEGFFRKQDYVYDEHFDCYLCPSGETLKYSTTNKEGYREYKLPKQICTTCSFLSRCTKSKDCQKVVTRHIWQTHVEEADHLRHHQDVKPIYAKCKDTIERVFADAKEKHGIRWTILRGLKKLSMQAMLTFAAINLTKMANWTWRGPKMA
ncbi:transposase, partial [Peribacillus frigoritolerans]|uniref:transposase n=1 Tax=Peribacillus frigoritolerans TaxID=450367 RepID=UPI002E1D40A2|nr:transposase [Peribacillus frigoritolerans]